MKFSTSTDESQGRAVYAQEGHATSSAPHTGLLRMPGHIPAARGRIGPSEHMWSGRHPRRRSRYCLRQTSVSSVAGYVVPAAGTLRHITFCGKG